MLKIFGIVLLLCGGALLTSSINKKAAARLELTEGWIDLISYIKNRVELFSLPISDILRECSTEQLRRCGYVGVKRPVDLLSMLEKTERADVETQQIVESFSREFGKCYRKEQVKRCEICIAQLEIQRNRMKEQLPTRKRLTATLCMSGCLGVALFFL